MKKIVLRVNTENMTKCKAMYALIAIVNIALIL